MEKYFSLGQAAREIGVTTYRIAYAITNQKVAEPKHWMVGRRAFSESEVQALKKYFVDHPKLRKKKERE
jgi:hypothetical protein